MKDLKEINARKWYLWAFRSRNYPEQQNPAGWLSVCLSVCLQDLCWLTSKGWMCAAGPIAMQPFILGFVVSLLHEEWQTVGWCCICDHI